METESTGWGTAVVRRFLCSPGPQLLQLPSVTRTGIAPKGPPPPADDEDLFLLGDAVTSSLAPGLLPSSLAGATVGERKKVDVSWLRRTEYLSSEAGNKVTGGTGGLGCVHSSPPSVSTLPPATRAS